MTGEVTPYDVLLMLAMQELETGERPSVVETLTSLGMDDLVEAAKIGLESEEDDEELVDDPDPDGDPGDAEIGDVDEA